MSLERLIESYYSPKKGNELLIKLIESKANNLLYLAEAEEIEGGSGSSPFYGEEERYVKFPRIMISKNLGKKNDYDRSFLNLVVQNLKEAVGGKSDLLKDRIQNIQNFMTSPATPNMSVSEIMAYSMIVETFYHLIHDYDATVAGDLLEAIFAGLFNGTVVEAEDGKRNFEAEDVLIEGMAISLKLYKDGASFGQNFTNVLKSIKKYGSLIYVVGYKGDEQIKFYQLELNQNNIWPSNNPKERTIISNFKKLVGNYDINNRNIDNLISHLESMSSEYDAKKTEYELKKKEYEQLRAAAINKQDAEPEYLKQLLANAPVPPEKLETQMSITASIVRPNLIGTIYYKKEDLFTKLESYVSQINTYIKVIYDNLTILNNSINDFFLRKEDRDKYAGQAIRSAREVENNLRQQLQQDTGKKFILRR